jgi:membrane protein DedA with SNARE-associated domain
MSEMLQFLIRNGYIVLFAWVFAEQIGLPLPAIPLLFAAGALAGTGKLNLLVALALAVCASLVGDLIWYEVGRRKGGSVLNFLCRISLEPDSCVRNTESAFARHGARSLLVAKFVPGLSTAAPPLAGIFQMRRGRFLLFDGLGALIWAGAFVGLGFLFSNQLERLVGPHPAHGEVAAGSAPGGPRLVHPLEVH